MSKKTMCSLSDLRTDLAMDDLKRNLENIPIEELEKFVEQFKALTA